MSEPRNFRGVVNNEQIKFWLPRDLKEQISKDAAASDMSVAQWLRAGARYLIREREAGRLPAGRFPQ